MPWQSHLRDIGLFTPLVHVQEVLWGSRGTRHSEGALKRPKNLFESGIFAAFGEIFRLRFAPLKMTSLQKGLLETALGRARNSMPTRLFPHSPVHFQQFPGN
jgi:hypothetical protein